MRTLAERTEEQGFAGVWLGAAFGFDTIMASALAGDVTSTIELGVAVVPTWPRHPIVMAQQAALASAATGGRFRLGIGPSHAPVMGMYGIDFDRPISHVREYLTIVRALLAGGRVEFEGTVVGLDAWNRLQRATFPLFRGFTLQLGEVYDCVDPDTLIAEYRSEAVVVRNANVDRNRYNGVADGRIAAGKEFHDPEATSVL